MDWEQKDRKKIQEVAASFLEATAGYSSQDCICIIKIIAVEDNIKAIWYCCCILVKCRLLMNCFSDGYNDTMMKN